MDRFKIVGERRERWRMNEERRGEGEVKEER